MKKKKKQKQKQAVSMTLRTLDPKTKWRVLASGLVTKTLTPELEFYLEVKHYENNPHYKLQIRNCMQDEEDRSLSLMNLPNLDSALAYETRLAQTDTAQHEISLLMFRAIFDEIPMNKIQAIIEEHYDYPLKQSKTHLLFVDDVPCQLDSLLVFLSNECLPFEMRNSAILTFKSKIKKAQEILDFLGNQNIHPSVRHELAKLIDEGQSFQNGIMSFLKKRQVPEAIQLEVAQKLENNLRFKDLLVNLLKSDQAKASVRICLSQKLAPNNRYQGTIKSIIFEPNNPDRLRVNMINSLCEPLKYSDPILKHLYNESFDTSGEVKLAIINSLPEDIELNEHNYAFAHNPQVSPILRMGLIMRINDTSFRDKAITKLYAEQKDNELPACTSSGLQVTDRILNYLINPHTNKDIRMYLVSTLEDQIPLDTKVLNFLDKLYALPIGKAFCEKVKKDNPLTPEIRALLLNPKKLTELKQALLRDHLQANIVIDSDIIHFLQSPDNKVTLRLDLIDRLAEFTPDTECFTLFREESVEANIPYDLCKKFTDNLELTQIESEFTYPDAHHLSSAVHVLSKLDYGLSDEKLNKPAVDFVFKAEIFSQLIYSYIKEDENIEKRLHYGRNNYGVIVEQIWQKHKTKLYAILAKTYLSTGDKNYTNEYIYQAINTYTDTLLAKKNYLGLTFSPAVIQYLSDEAYDELAKIFLLGFIKPTTESALILPLLSNNSMSENLHLAISTRLKKGIALDESICEYLTTPRYSLRIKQHLVSLLKTPLASSKLVLDLIISPELDISVLKLIIAKLAQELPPEKEYLLLFKRPDIPLKIKWRLFRKLPSELNFCSEITSLLESYKQNDEKTEAIIEKLRSDLELDQDLMVCLSNNYELPNIWCLLSKVKSDLDFTLEIDGLLRCLTNRPKQQKEVVDKLKADLVLSERLYYYLRYIQIYTDGSSETIIMKLRPGIKLNTKTLELLRALNDTPKLALKFIECLATDQERTNDVKDLLRDKRIAKNIQSALKQKLVPWYSPIGDYFNKLKPRKIKEV